MTARVRWTALAALVVLALVAVVISRHTTPARVATAAGAPNSDIVTSSDLPVLDAGPAPSVQGNAGWLNTAPLGAGDLAGKVVLYDFWTFDCVNCQHTLSHVNAWQQRYAGEGLVIVSIHTPEFDYEADPANVASFLAEHEIVYPVALDPERAVWRAWGNHYWPAFYLYDAQNRLRVQHFGEGGYDSTEDAIRVLLGIAPNSPRAEV